MKKKYLQWRLNRAKIKLEYWNGRMESYAKLINDDGYSTYYERRRWVDACSKYFQYNELVNILEEKLKTYETKSS